MSRLEIVSLSEFLNLFRCQRIEEFLHELAQKSVAQTVDALEMFEVQNEPFEMRGLEFAVDAVERMSQRMGDFAALQISLQGVSIVPDNNDIVVLMFSTAPYADV